MSKKQIFFTLPASVRKEQEALDFMWDKFVLKRVPVDRRTEVKKDDEADTKEEG